MVTNIHFFLRIREKTLLQALIAAILLTACGASSNPYREIAQPATQPLAPTRIIVSLATQRPSALQEPTKLPMSAPTRTEPTVSKVSACALLKNEEVEAAIGSLVGEPIELDSPPLYGCDFKNGGINEVGVSLTVFNDAEQANAALQMVIDLNNYEEVSGIGDRAIRTEIGDIDVIKGRYDIMIDVVNDADKDARFEMAKNLALAALQRLP